jgi:guanylate kinase
MSTFEASHALWKPSQTLHECLLDVGLARNLVVSGPMGGNKSGTCRSLREWIAPYDLATHKQTREFSVSWASRSKRSAETDGVEYHFDVPVEKFRSAYEQGDLLEMVEHAGGAYGTPMPKEGTISFYEIEVTGVKKGLENPHHRARQFGSSLLAIYIAQQSIEQLFDQILHRNDGMSEEKKIERASRYPAEMQYIIDNQLPYSFIDNVPGEISFAHQAAIRVAAYDPEAPILKLSKVQDRIAEAKQHLFENNISLPKVA